MKKVLYSQNGLSLYENASDPNHIYINNVKIPYEDWIKMKSTVGGWEQFYHHIDPKDIVSNALNLINQRKTNFENAMISGNKTLISLAKLHAVLSFGNVEDSLEDQCYTYIKTLPTHLHKQCEEELERLFGN